MVLQLRPIGGGTPYAPARDVANIFPFVCKLVALRLEQQPWEEVRRVCAERGVSDTQLGEAIAAFARFCVIAHEDPREDMATALRRAKWFDCHPTAQLAVMCYLGQVLAGVFFSGIRDAMSLGDPVRTDVAQLLTYAKRSVLLLSLPRWKRALLRWRWPFRRWFGRFRISSRNAL